MLQTQQRIHERGIVVLGVDLTDAREEMFVRMVCDGIAIGLAFIKAGFKETEGNSKNFAAHRLFNLPRIQQRAAAILEARRTTGVVTLPEVTDMLQRVFSKAIHDDQMNAAHNAAFSLARLYGHVTDRAVIETLRKPSRDPDAPAERSLSNWIDALPLKGPSPEPSEGLPEAGSASPRAAIGQGSGLATYQRLGHQGSGLDVVSGQHAKPLISQGSGLGDEPIHVDVHRVPHVNVHTGLGDGHPQSGNGAPVRPVTGTPNRRGQSAVLAKAAGVSRETMRGTPDRKQVQKRNKVPVPSGAQKRKLKRMKELFG